MLHLFLLPTELVYILGHLGVVLLLIQKKEGPRGIREKNFSELRHNSTKSGFFSGTQKDVNLSLFRDSTNIEMKK